MAQTQKPLLAMLAAQLGTWQTRKVLELADVAHVVGNMEDEGLNI